jgi:hypothetical protein
MISTRTRIHTWRVPAPRKMLPTNGSTAIVGGFGRRSSAPSMPCDADDSMNRNLGQSQSLLRFLSRSIAGFTCGLGCSPSFSGLTCWAYTPAVTHTAGRCFLPAAPFCLHIPESSPRPADDGVCCHPQTPTRAVSRRQRQRQHQRTQNAAAAAAAAWPCAVLESRV